jgi:hypothetical protein
MYCIFSCCSYDMGGLYAFQILVFLLRYENLEIAHHIQSASRAALLASMLFEKSCLND